MSAANSATLLAIINEAILDVEGGMKDVPLFADFPFLRKWVDAKLDEGGGEGDTVSFRVPFQIKDSTLNTTVSNTYKASTNNIDATIADKMEFAYSWINQDFKLYRQEVELAKNKSGGKDFKEIVQFRHKNALNNYQEQVLIDLFTGDGSSNSILAGFQSIWQGSTYGGVTRTTYPDRLDCANATTVLQGGYGTKITTPIPLDGKTIYQYLINVISQVSFNGRFVTDMFCGPDVWGALRSYLGDKYLTSVAMTGRDEAGKNITPDRPAALEMNIDGVILHLVDRRLITAGHIFGIRSDLLSIRSVENYPLFVKGPFNEVDIPTTYGAKSIQYQGSGRLYTPWPRAHFWLTNVGQG